METTPVQNPIPAAPVSSNSGKRLVLAVLAVAVLAACGYYLYNAQNELSNGSLGNIGNLSDKPISADIADLPPAPVQEVAPVEVAPVEVAAAEEVPVAPVPVLKPIGVVGLPDLEPIVGIAEQIAANNNLGNDAPVVPAEPVAVAEPLVVDNQEPAVDQAANQVVNNYYGGSSNASRINELEAQLEALKNPSAKSAAELKAEQTAANLAAASRIVVLDSVQDQPVARVAEPVQGLFDDDPLHGAANKKLNNADASAIERAFAEDSATTVNASTPIVRVTATKQAVNGSSIRGDTGPEVLLYPSLVALANGAYIVLRKKKK